MVGLAPGQQGLAAHRVQSLGDAATVHGLPGLQPTVPEALHHGFNVNFALGRPDRREQPEGGQGVAGRGVHPCPGQDQFIIGSPIFKQSTLHLHGGDFTISAPDTSDTNRYVASATLNGQPLDLPFLKWQDLLNATLALQMTDKPTGFGA